MYVMNVMYVMYTMYVMYVMYMMYVMYVMYLMYVMYVNTQLFYVIFLSNIYQKMALIFGILADFASILSH